MLRAFPPMNVSSASTRSWAAQWHPGGLGQSEHDCRFDPILIASPNAGSQPSGLRVALSLAFQAPGCELAVLSGWVFVVPISRSKKPQSAWEALSSARPRSDQLSLGHLLDSRLRTGQSLGRLRSLAETDTFIVTTFRKVNITESDKNLGDRLL